LLPELAPLPDEALETPVIPETERTELAAAIAEEPAENDVSAALGESGADQAAIEEAPAESQTETQAAVSPTMVETETAAVEDAQIEETVDEAQTPARADVEPDAEVVDPVIRAVQAAPASAQFVQHIVYSNRARATAWQASQPNLMDALVVPITINGATQFAVVSGPFVDQGRTRAFVQGLGADADYWVRTAGSLQQILQTGE